MQKSGASKAPTVDVQRYVRENITPWGGDASFLAGPTQRTLQLWDTVQVGGRICCELMPPQRCCPPPCASDAARRSPCRPPPPTPPCQAQALCAEELKKGIMGVDPSMPSTITAFPPGYIDKDKE